jgi:hypothetical protein
LLIPAPADPTMQTAPIRIIGVWVMMHVAAVTGIIAPAPSPGGAGMGGKSDEHQRKPAHAISNVASLFIELPPHFAGHYYARAKTGKPRAFSYH